MTTLKEKSTVNGCKRDLTVETNVRVTILSTLG